MPNMWLSYKVCAHFYLFYSLVLIICLALSKENRQALAEMNDTPIPDDLMELDDTQGVDGNSGRDWEPVVDFLDNDEAFTEAMRQTFEHRCVPCKTFLTLIQAACSHTRPRVYRDTRTWRQRLERQQSNWKAVLPSLMKAFLKWKYVEPTTTSNTTSDTTSDTFDANISAPPSADTIPSVDVDPVSYDFSLDCVDLYTLATSIYVPRTSSMTAVEALMIQGYLATSPVDPTLAISIKTLELFRRLRCRKASLSVEAYAKVLCDLYAVSI